MLLLCLCLKLLVRNLLTFVRAKASKGLATLLCCMVKLKVGRLDENGSRYVAYVYGGQYFWKVGGINTYLDTFSDV